MTWIKTLTPAEAGEKLKALFDRLAAPGEQIDNIMAAHSLRPHTLEGHMALYKAVLHHFGNSLDRTLLEAIGVHVSHLNQCDYCVRHHAAGLARLIGNEETAERMTAALTAGDPASAFEAPEVAALRYAARLTESPRDITASDIGGLRQAGFSDGEILEINQVAAYFAYANRVVLGLGVTADGEELGLSPRQADEVNDWRHR